MALSLVMPEQKLGERWRGPLRRAMRESGKDDWPLEQGSSGAAVLCAKKEAIGF